MGFNKFSAVLSQLIRTPYNNHSFLVNANTEISTGTDSLWHAKFVESFKLISKSSNETLKLNINLLESTSSKILPHLALQVDGKSTNFTGNLDIFMSKHWPNFSSYNPNKVTFSCEFIQQSSVGDLSEKKISATTPFIETSEIDPYFITKPLDFIQLSPNLENLFLGISGSPHFLYHTSLHTLYYWRSSPYYRRRCRP